MSLKVLNEAVYYGKSVLESAVTNYLKEYCLGKLMNIDLIQELLSTSRDRKNEVVDLDNVRSVKKKRL